MNDDAGKGWKEDAIAMIITSSQISEASLIHHRPLREAIAFFADRNTRSDEKASGRSREGRNSPVKVIGEFYDHGSSTCRACSVSPLFG